MDAAKGGLFLRKVLLIVQFSLAIIVFISALTVSRQVAYVFNKDLGYNKEQLLVITAFPKQWDTAGVMRMENIKKGLLQLPVVKNASIAFEIPERKPPSTVSLQPLGQQSNPLIVSEIDADEDYASTFGLQLKAGSFFNHGNGGYIPWQIVLNETAVNLLGLTAESAIGKRIKNTQSSQIYTIAGVIKDYNYASLQQAIEPLAFVHVNDAKGYRYLTLKLNTPDIAKAIDDIRQKWKSLSPNAPFEYTFMDEKFQSLYQSELQLKKAANVATGLNLIIVFLGIFGAVTFTLTKRTKEIAMRKVLGADVKSIILLFMKDYALLIVIANIIAWPLAFAVTNKWLQNYAYRMQQDIIPYLFVCAFTFILAFGLIAAQCFKAAAANPVKSLRTE
jgi:ABC-type antimicrobial peptide transport system permease subunit